MDCLNKAKALETIAFVSHAPVDVDNEKQSMK
jgi:hypothetical protein